MQAKPEAKHTDPDRAPQPGVAGYKWSEHTNTHTPQHPNQEWQGTAETRAQAHIRTPCTPARIDGVQGERAHKHPHTRKPQPGVAGRSRNPSPSTHTQTAHPSQEWRGTSEARTQTHTHPNTPAMSGGAEPKPEPKHTHPHRTPEPGVAGYERSPHANMHRAKHPSQEWRGAAETRAQAHKPTPQTRASNGGVQTERALNHTHPKTPARNDGVQAKTRAQQHTPQTRARNRGAKPNPYPSTHTQDPSQEWRGYNETQTQIQAPHNSRKPSVYSRGTEAARAMQVTRPNEIQIPRLRLHPKACAALGLEAERATPKHLGTPVPRT